MFTTYAVRLQDGQKIRAVVGTYESEDEARHWPPISFTD